MALSPTVFEEYVVLFRKKVATLDLSETKANTGKMKGKKEEATNEDVPTFEFELAFPEEQAEESVEENAKELISFMFLKKFDEVLPKPKLERLQFLLEAHHRRIIQVYPTTDRHNGAAKIIFEDFGDEVASRTPIDFLEVFFCFSLLAKEIGCAAKSFPSLMLNCFKEWFPNEILTSRLNDIEKDSDAFFYLYSLAHFVLSGQSKCIDLSSFKKYISIREYLLFVQSIHQNHHALIASGDWRVEKDMFDEESNIIITSKGAAVIFPEAMQVSSASFEGYDLIAPQDIPVVSLHYASKTKGALDRLKTMLKSIPPAVWNSKKLGILLAGEAGCGKTEFVAQVCRELGYYYMNVGSQNSKWVGETEQNIKRILEFEYPRLMKEHNNKVILCMNEMDQIIGVKTSVTTHSSFHTNAGVSQILRSLDTFKGIIVGTLNELSPERCEPAAIRRFQTLITFNLPDFETRKSIWASREGFWQHSPSLIARLAQYELSGSDIHSICEKGFFLQFAGETFAENALFDFLEEQVELSKKTRYVKSHAATIGFQKIAS